MTHRFRVLWYRFKRRIVKILNDALPGRPSVDLKAVVSFRAKIEGHAKNIHVASGARIREDAWLNCIDAGSRIEIGPGTLIMPYAKLVSGFGGWIKIGRNCTIHSFDVLYGYTGGLTLGDEVRTGTNVTLISSNHNFDDLTRGMHEQGFTSRGIVIGDNVWIGAGVIVLDGVTVGPNTVLAAGAVVTKSVPESSICAGVPAVVKRRRGEKILQSQP
jgi:acetyltransferase-like isoleucine patch superfamily enzyme